MNNKEKVRASSAPLINTSTLALQKISDKPQFTNDSCGSDWICSTSQIRDSKHIESNTLDFTSYRHMISKQTNAVDSHKNIDQDDELLNISDAKEESPITVYIKAETVEREIPLTYHFNLLSTADIIPSSSLSIHDKPDILKNVKKFKKNFVRKRLGKYLN